MASMLKDDLNVLKKDIRALRDEVKLKVHLAGMDLQTEWQKIEPKAETFLHEVTQTSSEAANEVKKSLLELKKRLEAPKKM